MPRTIQIPASAALNVIAEQIKLRTLEIKQAKKAVEDSRVPETERVSGPNVTLHRDVVEGLLSALETSLDLTDGNITVG